MARETRAARPATIPNPRRRGLLTGTIAALLAGTAATVTARAASLPAPGDDAELIRLCADFHRLTAAMAAWSPDDDDGFDAKLSERWAVSDRIMSLAVLLPFLESHPWREQVIRVAKGPLAKHFFDAKGGTISARSPDDRSDIAKNP